MHLPAFVVWLAVYAVSLPWARSGPYAAPELDLDRTARVTMIAEENARAAALYASPRDVAALALAVTVTEHAESGGFDPRIHAGEIHPRDHQDHGRARCLGQIHPSRWFPRPVWRALAGVSREATARCAGAVARLLVSAMRTCGVGGRFDEPSLARAFAQYASGHSCEPTRESRFRACRWARGYAALRAAAPAELAAR